MTKKIVRIDASAIKDSGCEFRYDAIVIGGYREKITYNDTLYGTAVHKYLSRMEESNGNFAEAVKAALITFKQPCKIRNKKEHLNENHLVSTCFDYWQYIHEKQSNFKLLVNPESDCWACENQKADDTRVCLVCNGTKKISAPMVEIKFSILYYSDAEIDIYIEGTIDRVGKIDNGCYCIRDFKSTSSWKADEFLRSFKSAVQFKVYLWAIKRMARMAGEDSPLYALAKSPVGVCIDGIFLKSSKETEFKSSEVFQFKDAQMEEFESMLAVKVSEIMSYALKLKEPTKNGKMTGLCYTGFYCKFFDYCHALDDVVASYILKNNYNQRPYSPLRHGEVIDI